MSNLKDWWNQMYEWRYYLLLAALVLLILMPGFFSQKVNDQIIWPLNRTLLLVACLNMIRNMNRGIILIALIGFLATSSDWLAQLQLGSNYVGLSSLLLFSLFITIVTYEGFRQILNASKVDVHVIVGAFDGFLLVGVIGGLVYSYVHLLYPNSFQGVKAGIDGLNELMYFSYVTIITIGYGDIVPNSEAARRISIFLGLIGQFYLVVVMAVLVGKYISKPHRSNETVL